MQIMVADTETTGQEDSARVCEIAWQMLDENLDEKEKFVSLIDPEKPISHGASGIHHIVDSDIVDAPTMDELFSVVLLDKFKWAEIFFVAHNAKFDEKFFRPYVRIKQVVCTLRLARRYFPDVENHKLSTLIYALDLPGGTSHRADGDVETTVGLLRKLVRKSKKTFAELAKESLLPIKVESMPFGKHKGEALKNVPSGYIKWLLDQADIDEDLRWSIMKLKS